MTEKDGYLNRPESKQENSGPKLFFLSVTVPCLISFNLTLSPGKQMRIILVFNLFYWQYTVGGASWFSLLGLGRAGFNIQKQPTQA